MGKGELVADRFSLSEALGTSRTGELFRAVDQKTGATVTLRLLRGMAPEIVRRAMTDLDDAGSLVHPGFVRHVAHGLHDGRAFVANEWVEGENLEGRLSRGALSIEEVLALAARLADALACLHARGLVHGDVNPGNVHLPGGDVRAAKLGNWGLSSWAASPGIDGLTVGTPGSMSPEQLRGEPLDSAADVFSLGCVLYQAVSGTAPFVGASAAAVQAKIFLAEPERLETREPATPVTLADLVSRMLSKRPSGRPPDGDSVRAELADLATEISTRLSRHEPISETERELASLILFSWAEREPMPEAVQTLLASHSVEVVGKSDAEAALAVKHVNDVEEQVVRAARIALSLAALDDVVTVSLATVHDEPSGISAAIDRAARPVSVAEGHWVAIDDVTDGLLPSRFQRARGSGGLALIAELDALDVPRAVLGREAPLVERAAELAHLVDHTVEQLRRSRAGVVLVSGPLGIGKSRLRQEGLRRLGTKTPDLVVWAVRGDPARAEHPLELASTLLRKVTGVELPAPGSDGPAADAERRKIVARVSRHLPAHDATRVAQFVGELIGLPFPDDDPLLAAARTERATMMREIERAVVDLFDAETKAAPLLLVLEDVHWADAASLSLMGEIVHALSDRPLMLWISGRPELRERLASWDSGQRGMITAHIALGELTPSGARTLSESLLGPEAGKRVVEAVAARGLGVPLFLEELSMSIAEGIDEDASKPLLALFAARLGRLSPDARRVARAAALVGLVFWRGALAVLLPRTRKTAIDAGLSALATGGWIVEHSTSRFPQERELAFRHDGLRDAAESLSTEEDRELAHGIVARWLETAGERDASLVAMHFVRAGLGHLAATHYARAAESALLVGDVGEAIHRTARGLSCCTDPPVTGWLSALRAEAFAKKHETREALVAARVAMRTLATLPGFPSERWYRAAAMAAEAAGEERDLGVIVEVSQALMADDAGRAATHARAIAVACAAEALVRGGLTPEAEPLCEWLLTAVPALEGDAPAVGRALRTLGLDARERGDWSTARNRLVTAADQLDIGGDPRLAVATRLEAAEAAIELGLSDLAEPELVRVVAVLRSVKISDTTVLASQALAVALARRGATTEAVATAREAAHFAATIGDRRLEGGARVLVATILVHAGQIPDAVVEAQAAVELLALAPRETPLARAILADALRASGDVADAVRESEEATAAVYRLGDVQGDVARVHLASAEAHLAAGNFALALQAIGRASASVRAAKLRIADPTARESYVALVPDHARVRALARQHGLEAP